MISLTMSAAALIVSITALVMNRKQWRITNRPDVYVRLINPKAGNAGTPYELQVLNIGNRPAFDVRLKTDQQALLDAYDSESKSDHNDIEACFSEATTIGLLTPGESTVAAFGYNSHGDCAWKMESVLPIEIHYRDGENRAFVTEGTLRIRTRNGFSGYTWGDRKAE